MSKLPGRTLDIRRGRRGFSLLEVAMATVVMIIVSLKYVTLVLHASNRGEGGIMALLALATSSVRELPRLRAALLGIGVTPVVSVPGWGTQLVS